MNRRPCRQRVKCKQGTGTVVRRSILHRATSASCIDEMIENCINCFVGKMSLLFSDSRESKVERKADEYLVFGLNFSFIRCVSFRLFWIVWLPLTLNKYIVIQALKLNNVKFVRKPNDIFFDRSTFLFSLFNKCRTNTHKCDTTDRQGIVAFWSIQHRIVWPVIILHTNISWSLQKILMAAHCSTKYTN